MLLFPKQPRFTKSFSGKKLLTKNKKNASSKYGNIVLIANETSKITNYQQESMRRFLRRFFKKKAQLFFRVFPNTPITKKPNDVRLGRGKGAAKYWASNVKKGTIIVEIRCFDNALAKQLLNKVKVKLSTKAFTFDRQTRWIL